MTHAHTFVLADSEGKVRGSIKATGPSFLFFAGAENIMNDHDIRGRHKL